MRLIKREGVTEYYAKKRCVDAAVKYFQKNPEKYFVSVLAEWNDKLHSIKGEASVIVRREIISQFYGIDFVVSQKHDLSKLAPRDKDQYMELWDALVKHQPKHEELQKSASLAKRIKEQAELLTKKTSK